MSSIEFLKLLKATKANQHLHDHFILKVQNKFMVFTSNPINGLNNYFISSINIKGEFKNQYLIDKIHQYDSVTMTTKIIQSANEYFILNQPKLQPFLDSMQHLLPGN